MGCLPAPVFQVGRDFDGNRIYPGSELPSHGKPRLVPVLEVGAGHTTTIQALSWLGSLRTVFIASPMDTLDRYFDDDALRRSLCSERLAAARRAHDRNFFQRAGHASSDNARSPEILDYFPPRARWFKPTPSERRTRNTSLRAQENLWLTVDRLIEAGAPEDQAWIARQQSLFARLRHRVLGARSLKIQHPHIIPVRKTSGNASDYRVLAAYNLEDKLLLGQTARYLRTIFDGLFLECSCAFRIYNSGWGSTPTHHDGMRRLIHFWERIQSLPNSSTWVVEADIVGFFDAVSHDIVRREYESRCRELESSGMVVDARARRVVHAYLRSYDYNRFGREEGLSSSTCSFEAVS